jgi:Histidine phosphatase superfamily (branch 2)/Diphosphoinositol pentakisphosphate kinase 2 N-terminal domain/RimK-like ATP-grasp domain
MEVKTKSRPMRELMACMIDAAQKDGWTVEVVKFTNRMLNLRPVEMWPRVDCLAAINSGGFPLDKAIHYGDIYPRMLQLNDPRGQRLLQDRMLVYKKLRELGVPTPNFAAVLRSAPDEPGSPVVREVGDALYIGNKRLVKPFVEKPLDADNHDVWVYFPQDQGGGVRKLFRKTGDQASAFEQVSGIRTDQSYVYEEFVFGERLDCKVYAVGTDYAHAEQRKAPTTDGRVERTADGKEVRRVTKLTRDEQTIAGKISKGFRQFVCGFDLLRAPSTSVVCDVNGWSRVKNFPEYWLQCGRRMHKLCVSHVRKQMRREEREDRGLWHHSRSRSPSRSPFASSASSSTTSLGVMPAHVSTTPLTSEDDMMSAWPEQPPSASTSCDSLSAVDSALDSDDPQQHQHQQQQQQQPVGAESPLADAVDKLRSVAELRLNALRDVTSMPDMRRGTHKLGSMASLFDPESPRVTATDASDNGAVDSFDDDSVGEHTLIGVSVVFRHADRTPKQKLKLKSAHPKLLARFAGVRDAIKNWKELKLKNTKDDAKKKLAELAAVCLAIADTCVEPADAELSSSSSSSSPPPPPRTAARGADAHTAEVLRSMASIMTADLPGTKVQLKPVKFAEAPPDNRCMDDGLCTGFAVVSVMLVCKWGGMLTDAGVAQSRIIGREFFDRIVPELSVPQRRRWALNLAGHVYSNDERRVKLTAEVVTDALVRSAHEPVQRQQQQQQRHRHRRSETASAANNDDGDNDDDDDDDGDAGPASEKCACSDSDCSGGSSDDSNNNNNDDDDDSDNGETRILIPTDEREKYAGFTSSSSDYNEHHDCMSPLRAGSPAIEHAENDEHDDGSENEASVVVEQQSGDGDSDDDSDDETDSDVDARNVSVYEDVERSSRASALSADAAAAVVVSRIVERPDLLGDCSAASEAMERAKVTIEEQAHLFSLSEDFMALMPSDADLRHTMRASPTFKPADAADSLRSQQTVWRNRFQQLLFLVTNQVRNFCLHLADAADRLGGAHAVYADETLEHMVARWKRLWSNLYNVPKNRFNLSKVPAAYDYAKFDAAHNSALTSGSAGLLRELLHTASWLAAVVLSCEYGCTRIEKLRIGSLVSQPLLQHIVHRSLRQCTQPKPRSRLSLYFTSESHIATLVNLLVSSPIVDSSYAIRGECNYLSHVCFKLYRHTVSLEYSYYYVDILLSTGAEHDVFNHVDGDHVVPINRCVLIERVRLFDLSTLAVSFDALYSDDDCLQQDFDTINFKS